VAQDLSGVAFGGPLTCDYLLEMDLLATGQMFEGPYRQSSLVCHFSGQAHLVSLGQGQIVDGSMSGDQVRFDIDAESAHNRGTIEGDQMGGQVEVELVIQQDLQIDTVQVVGDWSATR